MLALGWAGASSFIDLEEDGRLEDCSLGETAPLMAASKNSRSLRLRLRNICVGVLKC